MSTSPAVSIVMPVYNAGAYLAPAIASMFAQTFTDWELIAVDDASTDGSWEYLQRIDDQRVRLARNDRNMRQSYTQNRGLDMARGKWIARMDADDMSVAARLEKQIAVLEAQPRLDVLGCGSIGVYGDLRPFLVTRPVVSHEEIVRWACMNFPLLHGGLVGKAEWFRRWRANPKMKLAQDFDLLFRAHKNSVFGNIQDILYIVRCTGGTSSVWRKIESVHYKSMALLQNGFKMGLYKDTLIGLASMVPRPLLYLIKAALGNNEKGLLKSQGVGVSDADKDLLRAYLAQLSDVEVPLKRPAK